MLPQRDAAYRCSPTRPDPIFHHVRLDAGRPNSKPETDQLAVPEEVLGFARLSRVDGPFCDALPHPRASFRNHPGTTPWPSPGMTKDDRLTKTAAPQAILNVKAKWGMKRNVTRPDSKSGGLTPVLVRVRPGAPRVLHSATNVP